MRTYPIGLSSNSVAFTSARDRLCLPRRILREAERVKADKITIFTIGLGEDLDVDALKSIANAEEHYFHAPDAEDLADIYSKVTVEIPCPAEDYWGRR